MVSQTLVQCSTNRNILGAKIKKLEEGKLEKRNIERKKCKLEKYVQDNIMLFVSCACGIQTGPCICLEGFYFRQQ